MVDSLVPLGTFLARTDQDHSRPSLQDGSPHGQGPQNGTLRAVPGGPDGRMG